MNIILNRLLNFVFR